MNYLPAFITPRLVEALGWTILHSLWQGALIAVTLSVLMILLHRHSARVRYAVAITALFSTLAIAGITFIRTYQQVQQPVTVTIPTQKVTQPLVNNPADKTTSAITNSNPGSAKSVLRGAILVNFKYYFSKHLPVVVLIWLLGMLTMLLKFLGGLAYVQRLKHYKTYALGTTWNTRLANMAQSLRVNQPVQLFESALVKTPLVIGYLKPIILLPFGTIASLSPDQVEAILAHELAHIYRKDYLLNMLQTLIEILFFFNPAIWWMSDYVRVERENCCDDQAIALCGNPLVYARALANLETIAVKAPRLTLAFAGKDGSLLGRIKRLVQQPSRRPTFSEGFLAACVLIVGLTLISVSAVAGFNVAVKTVKKVNVPILTKVSAPEKVLATQPEEAAGNLKATILSLTDSVSGKKSDLVIIKNKKGDITELYVDGQKIPKANIADFRKEIDAALEATKQAPVLKPAAVPQQLAKTKKALERLELDRNQLSFSYSGDFDHFSDVPVPPVPPASPVYAVFPPIPPVPPVPPFPAKVKNPLEYLRSDEVTDKTLVVIDGKKTHKAKGQNSLPGLTDDNIRGINILKGEDATRKYGDEGKDGVVEVYTGKGKGHFFYYNSDADSTTLRQHAANVGRAEEERLHHLARMRQHLELQTKENEKRMQEQEVRMKELAIRMKADEGRRLKEHEARMKEHEIRMKEHKEREKEHRARAAQFEKIKKELIKDKLIDENSKNLSININQDGFTLNGVKQPAAVFEKYKKLFFPDRKDWSGSFNQSININED
ncbi:M56 family metallopeptidase [Adhaeribacter radiodurans]|uniref:M48 family metalloprotease n=1 Tax=Adhaeribacter radiodurans TaxID=2745197 RepID=A0A7L7LDA7_9BACT|nr:M56 family metallopeptidase [Adhaeribacter radiodurans]QMU30763.1 M48 family metalloprotease [Adhaeribacter radiodurans]